MSELTENNGAGDRNRTCDILITNPVEEQQDTANPTINGLSMRRDARVGTPKTQDPVQEPVQEVTSGFRRLSHSVAAVQKSFWEHQAAFDSFAQSVPLADLIQFVEDNALNLQCEIRPEGKLWSVCDDTDASLGEGYTVRTAIIAAIVHYRSEVGR